MSETIPAKQTNLGLAADMVTIDIHNHHMKIQVFFWKIFGIPLFY